MFDRPMTPAALTRGQGPSDALALVVWDNTLERYVRGWVFDTLQDAFDAVGEIALEDHETILLNGMDEEDHFFDAYEPEAGESANQFREDWARDCAEFDAACRSEARMMAGMSYGQAGLDDFDGYDYEEPDYY